MEPCTVYADLFKCLQTVIWGTNCIVTCSSDESQYWKRQTRDTDGVESAGLQPRGTAARTRFSDSVSWFIPQGNGMFRGPPPPSGRPTSGTQVVTRLCKSDVDKNISLSCYITGRKVKGKVRSACTAACDSRPPPAVRSSLRVVRAVMGKALARDKWQNAKLGFSLHV